MNEAYEPEIRRARIEIAKILQRLELETGALVSALSLQAHDVTTLASDAPQHLMSIRIEMARQPGHQW